MCCAGWVEQFKGNNLDTDNETTGLLECRSSWCCSWCCSHTCSTLTLTCGTESSSATWPPSELYWQNDSTLNRLACRKRIKPVFWVARGTKRSAAEMCVPWRLALRGQKINEHWMPYTVIYRIIDNYFFSVSASCSSRLKDFCDISPNKRDLRACSQPYEPFSHALFWFIRCNVKPKQIKYQMNRMHVSESYSESANGLIGVWFGVKRFWLNSFIRWTGIRWINFSPCVHQSPEHGEHRAGAEQMSRVLYLVFIFSFCSLLQITATQFQIVS